MPAAHREAFRRHYKEYPFGDFHVQHLLATIAIVLCNQCKDEKRPAFTIMDIAPHLVPPSIAAEIRKSKAAHLRATTMSIASDILDGRCRNRYQSDGGSTEGIAWCDA